MNRYKDALLKMYSTSNADKQNRVALIRTSQIYNIERWNNWVGNKVGPEPLSGYVGMVSLCKGATPPSANGVPAKVVVCLTPEVSVCEETRSGLVRVKEYGKPCATQIC